MVRLHEAEEVIRPVLEQFRTYLTETAHIQERYIPYYLKWVSKCYRFLDHAVEQPLSRNLKDQFLKEMAKRREKWKVRQADWLGVRHN